MKRKSGENPARRGQGLKAEAEAGTHESPQIDQQVRVDRSSSARGGSRERHVSQGGGEQERDIETVDAPESGAVAGAGAAAVAGTVPATESGTGAGTVILLRCLLLSLSYETVTASRGLIKTVNRQKLGPRLYSVVTVMIALIVGIHEWPLPRPWPVPQPQTCPGHRPGRGAEATGWRDPAAWRRRVLPLSYKRAPPQTPVPGAPTGSSAEDGGKPAAPSSRRTKWIGRGARRDTDRAGRPGEFEVLVELLATMDGS